MLSSSYRKSGELFFENYVILEYKCTWFSALTVIVLKKYRRTRCLSYLHPMKKSNFVSKELLLSGFIKYALIREQIILLKLRTRHMP